VQAALGVLLAAALGGPAVPPAAVAGPIPLPAPRGQRLLERSGQRADYAPLAQEFVTQANLAYCGVASIVMVLNSLAVPAPAADGYGSYRFWTQENVFDAAAARAVITPATVTRQGMTLQELADLLQVHGLSVRRLHGDSLSLRGFRSLLRGSLAEPADRLLVNYHRGAVGQEGGGHISPLAAYDAATDRALILDVARYRYPAVWVPAEDLWRAMRTHDSTSGRSRGLVLIRPAGEVGARPVSAGRPAARPRSGP
jgi:hypothetical protein